jgi:hypothetical protein
MTEIDIFIDSSESLRIFKNASGSLCLGVLCGGVGMYEAKILLSSEEVKQYNENGKAYIKQLANDIRKFTSKYESRFIP